MLDHRLDRVLEAGRTPDPADDGFTDRVVSVIREQDGRGWSRHVTRPVALAAAAVLLASGAAAAVRTVTPADVAASAPPAEVAMEVGAGASLDEAPAVPAQPGSQPAAAHRPPLEPRRPERLPVLPRRGTVSSGYDSSHRSWAQDDSGLRLETDTHTNEVPVGTPHQVTLTLSNTGPHPIGVSSSSGCMLTVTVFRMERERSHEPSRDPSPMMWCAEANGADENGQDSSQPQKLVLRPGESRTATATIGFRSAGNWALVGRCECRYAQMRAEPTPTERPTDRTPAPLLGGENPTEPPPIRSTPPPGRGSDLATPPIRIVSK